MEVYWSDHAKKRMLERALSLGISVSAVEEAVKKQRVKIRKGRSKKHGTKEFECIEKIGETLVTVQKAESKEMIFIITMRESGEREGKIWRKVTKAA